MAVVSIKNKLRRGNLLVGNDPYIPPDFESIATYTVGSGGASSITFSSIPSTYAHLQLRAFVRTTRTGGPDILGVRYNSDSGNNYADHLLYGDGSSAQVDKDTSYPQQNVHRISSDADTTGIFSGFVIDILDYANTNKYTTLRSLGGYDANGSGRTVFNSGLWMNTNAVNSIYLFSVYSENFKQYSHFALYGIKAAS